MLWYFSYCEDHQQGWRPCFRHLKVTSHFASFCMDKVIRTQLLYAEFIISSLLSTSAMYEVLELRACPCKNRPLKFSWKMYCLHFFYTSRATYAMNENGLYFDRFAFLIFWGIFFVSTPKTTQTGNWNPKNWGLRYACSNFAHSMKQPNSFRITG